MCLYREAFARLSGTRCTVESIEDTCKSCRFSSNYDPDKGKRTQRRLTSILAVDDRLQMVNESSSSISDRQTRSTTSMFFFFKLFVACSGRDDVFIKSLQSVQKIMIKDKNCFELYGYDILHWMADRVHCRND